MINTSITIRDGILERGRNCLSYTKVCLHGLYKRAAGIPTYKVVDQVTAHFTIAADPSISLWDKTTTYESVDFSNRSYYLFPTVKRAHIITNRELIKAGLQIPRDGDIFQSGLHAGFDDLIGPHNMLLHPDHARLRKPLERLFSTHTVQAPDQMKEIYIAALNSFTKMRK